MSFTATALRAHSVAAATNWPKEGKLRVQRSDNLEKVVTNSEQSGITMAACSTTAQVGIADWLAKGPYHEWKLQSYKCVLGQYIPKRLREALTNPLA